MGVLLPQPLERGDRDRRMIQTAPMPNRLIKIGAMMFFLWGVLHLFAGYLITEPFFTQGVGHNLAVLGLEKPTIPLDQLTHAASHLALNFGFDLAGYGVLAIWFAWFLWQGRHIQLSFWVLTIMLGIADLAFIYSLLLPGYSPLLEGIAGPVLYVLGVGFSGWGLKSLPTDHP